MKKLFLAGAIASALVAMPASAQWYIGSGVGASKVHGANATPAPLILSGVDSSKLSVKIYGGYHITPNWGIEAQYSDLGNRDFSVSNAAGTTLNRGTLRASQYSIAGTGTLPLTTNFSLFGKLGVSSNYGRASLLGASDSDSKTAAMASVGVLYNFTPKIAVRLEFEEFGNFVSLQYAF